MGFKALERKGRLTVVSQVTYQTVGKQVSSVVSRYSLPVLEDEQRYPDRPYAATEEWRPLDPGWVKEPGMVVIQNGREGWIQVGTTDDEGKYVIPLWDVPPGGDCRGIPSDFSRLRVRCAEDTCKFTVNVFPK